MRLATGLVVLEVPFSDFWEGGLVLRTAVSSTSAWKSLAITFLIATRPSKLSRLVIRRLNAQQDVSAGWRYGSSNTMPG
jgi:hypothetical protein